MSAWGKLSKIQGIPQGSLKSYLPLNFREVDAFRYWWNLSPKWFRPSRVRSVVLYHFEESYSAVVEERM